MIFTIYRYSFKLKSEIAILNWIGVFCVKCLNVNVIRHLFMACFGGFFVGVKLVLCDKNVNTFQINLMIFLRSIFLMKYWWKSVSPEGKELIQYVIDNAFMNKGIRMGKKPCNDATIVYSLFRNKLLLCNINSKSHVWN